MFKISSCIENIASKMLPNISCKIAVRDGMFFVAEKNECVFQVIAQDP